MSSGSEREREKSTDPNELTSSDDKSFHDNDDYDLEDDSSIDGDVFDGDKEEGDANVNVNQMANEKNYTATATATAMTEKLDGTCNPELTMAKTAFASTGGTSIMQIDISPPTVKVFRIGGTSVDSTESEAELELNMRAEKLPKHMPAQLDELAAEAIQIDEEIDDGGKARNLVTVINDTELGGMTCTSKSKSIIKVPDSDVEMNEEKDILPPSSKGGMKIESENYQTESISNFPSGAYFGGEACCLETSREQQGGIDVDSLRESVRESIECFYSAQDFLEYSSMLNLDSHTPDVESGYFERSESDISRDDNDLTMNSRQFRKMRNTIAVSRAARTDRSLSEGLRLELSRFEDMIKTIERESKENKEQNRREVIQTVLSIQKNHDECIDETLKVESNIKLEKIPRGYWSTVFGQASQIETGEELTLDERFADIQKAHRALELLEDYHARLSEPQDRALRIAIERVIRIFKSRLFQALLAQDFMAAYRYQSLCVQTVVKMLQQLKEENWCLPIMYTTCLDLRILAYKCEDLGNGSKPGEILEKAADCLMSCFRVCAADNRSSDDDTKRLGMLNLVNQLFKVYFRINKLHLCKPLIRAIESSAFKDSFPLPEQITYKYFVGRKAMFDSDYKSADEFLSFAFRNCPRNFPRNKRLILIYLVPVKMLLGYMPKKHILERFDVLQFHELAVALKEGNVRKFDEVIQRHEIFFIKCGIYLLVEKLKFIVYRNLFKRVYLIKQTHQLDLGDFCAALHFVGETDISIDETHCIVANLIFEGKIKGYISHSHNKLVVSKQNPFPALNTVS